MIAQDIASQTSEITSLGRSLRRCGSLPGRRLHRFEEARIFQRRCSELQQAADRWEDMEREQQYNAFDVMVTLDRAALKLRQGKTVEDNLPCLLPQMCQLKKSQSSSMLMDLKQPEKSPAASSKGRPKTLEKLSKPPLNALSFPIRAARKSQRKPTFVFNAAQLEALTSLATSLDKGESLTTVLHNMSRQLLTRQGEKPFTLELCTAAMAEVFKENGLPDDFADSDAEQRADLIVEGFRAATKAVDMNLSDATGQVLWRHRRSSVLQKDKHNQTSVDIRWVTSGYVDTDGKQKPNLEVVDDVFKVLSGENGRMSLKGWKQATRLVRKSPVLADRLVQSDVNRLWYAQTHRGNQEILRDIGCDDFKVLLLNLSEAMQVHPWMVFLAVACYSSSTPPTSRASTPPTQAKRSSFSIASSNRLADIQPQGTPA